MSGSPTFERLTFAALEEHRQIHFYLDQIDNTLEGLSADVADVEPMRRLAAQLEGLKERLAEHQQIEEGGLFQAILEVLPAHRVEIDRLTNEHARIIDILEMARLHALGGEPSEAEALKVDMQQFLEMFRRHEEAEDRLLAEAIKREGVSLD